MSAIKTTTNSARTNIGRPGESYKMHPNRGASFLKTMANTPSIRTTTYASGKPGRAMNVKTKGGL